MCAHILIEHERLKVNIIPRPIEKHRLVYKLHDLTPEEIKIVEVFNFEPEPSPQDDPHGTA